MSKFPKQSDDCEDMFIDSSGFELMCGKRNIYGDWILCDSCRDENVEFLEEYEKNRKKRDDKGGISEL